MNSLDQALKALHQAEAQLTPEERALPVTPLKTMNQLRVVGLCFAVMLIAASNCPEGKSNHEGPQL